MTLALISMAGSQGFSLHGGGLPSGVAVNTCARNKLERICLGGPAGISLAPRYRQKRLELTDQGMVRYVGAAFRLKSAYLRGPIGMGRRMWYLSGAAFRHWIGTRSLYGQTGSIGAKATNQPDRASQVRFHGVLARKSIKAQRLKRVFNRAAQVGPAKY